MDTTTTNDSAAEVASEEKSNKADSKARDPMGYWNVAKLWLEQHSTDLIPHAVYWRDLFHYWHEGRYTSRTTAIMTSEVLKWMMEAKLGSDHYIADKVTKCLQALRLNLDEHSQPFWLDPYTSRNDGNREWIAMESEMVSPPKVISGNKFTVSKMKLTPAWFSPCKLPYRFVEGATCPAWEEWLADRVPEEDLRLLLQEFFGYCLLPDNSRQSALFLVGESGTGKSTILQVLRAVVGADNCSHIPLDQFHRPFILGHSQGKLVNWCDETTDQLPKGIEQTLKWYISGTPMTIDRKYLSQVDMVPTARLVVAVNNWPRFRDATDGVWRRIHCVPVNKIIPRSQHRADVLQHLLRELPGIFNWALLGYRRLRDNNAFTETVAGAAEVKTVAAEQQSHKTWVAERVMAAKVGVPVSNQDIYGNYKSWCLSLGITPDAGVRTLTAEIQKRIPGAAPIRKKNSGSGLTVRGWTGIMLRRD